MTSDPNPKKASTAPTYPWNSEWARDDREIDLMLKTMEMLRDRKVKAEFLAKMRAAEEHQRIEQAIADYRDLKG